MCPYFYVQGVKIGSYELMTSIAAIAAFVYLYHSLSHIPIKNRQIYIFIFVGLLVQYFGGTIIPLVYRWFYLYQTPWFNVWAKSPGRYFHSVALSLLLFTILAAKLFKWPTRKVLDHSMIALMLGSAIGRIGCFLHGCCKGKPCNLPWAVRFPSHPELALHPTQIYMLIAETILFVYLIQLNRKKRYDGETFWQGVFLYSIYRVGIEFLRTNPPFLFGLTHAQVFSLLTGWISLRILLNYNRNYSPKTLPPESK